MKYIPSLIQERIERDSFLETYIREEEAKRPGQLTEQEARKKIEEIENRISSCCAIFQATRPKEWSAFESDMVTLYGVIKTINRRSPYEYLGEQKEHGTSVDAQFWTLIKAYTDGQIRMMETIFDSVPIDIKRIIENDKKQANKSFFKKFLHWCKSLI